MINKNNLNLNHINENDLLDWRISDLPIEIKGTWLEGCIDQLYRELEDKGITFKPVCYLAEEWLTPQYETCIGIPFYLAHPTLIKLEKKFMLEAEGEGREWCMKLLRHEAGHALSYAYRLHRRKKWRAMFGSPNVDYGQTYKYQPYSKNFVRHLDGFYAQYHPDEDFVETFAVWLTPNSQWEQKYRGWKAINKLQYVDELMNEISGKVPPVVSAVKYWKSSSLRIRLKNHYKRRRQELAEEFPDFHDPFLNRVFTPAGDNGKLKRASEVIRQYRRPILNGVSKYSGERKYIIHSLLKNMQKRSKELDLCVSQQDDNVALDLSSYVTSLTMNYMYTGKFQGEQKKRKSV